MSKLQGKTAVVTGGESGIGQAIAQVFAANGATVAVTYFDNEAAARVTLSKIEQAGSRGLIIKCDVTQPDEVAALFGKVYKELGAADILVNSAGVRGIDKPIHEMSFDEFDHTIKTNLYSVFLCCQNYVKHKLQYGGEGGIINISSVHEEVVSPGKTDYCSSKSALRGLCRSLAMELADKGITVNNIAPGMILTQMNQKAVDDKDYRKELEQRIPVKTSGTVEDVAGVVLFFASDDAKYITGTTQIVDGGLRLARAKGAK